MNHVFMNRRLGSAPVIVTIAAFLFAICSVFGQAPPAAQPQPTAPAASGAPVLVAKIVETLNTRSSKVGDPITAKTVKELKLKDGVDLPKGSKIVGTVASVQSAQDGKGNSTLAIKFDHVELKGGAIMRIQGLIVAIGVISNSDGLGYDGILGRGGVGSTPGLDPSLGTGGGNRDDIPAGSSLEGVALGVHLDPTGATVLRGVHRDIKLDSQVTIKVALFRAA
jgi:hypothetical protein